MKSPACMDLGPVMATLSGPSVRQPKSQTVLTVCVIVDALFEVITHSP